MREVKADCLQAITYEPSRSGTMVQRPGNSHMSRAQVRVNQQLQTSTLAWYFSGYLDRLQAVVHPAAPEPKRRSNQIDTDTAVSLQRCKRI